MPEMPLRTRAGCPAALASPASSASAFGPSTGRRSAPDLAGGQHGGRGERFVLLIVDLR